MSREPAIKAMLAAVCAPGRDRDLSAVINAWSDLDLETRQNLAGRAIRRAAENRARRQSIREQVAAMKKEPT